MGAAFAGIVRTPLTSVIMIFEITRDYTIIVPLMISNLIAFFISHKLQRQPIYEALARQEGVHLPIAHSRAVAQRIQVQPGNAFSAGDFNTGPTDRRRSPINEGRRVRCVARR